MGNDKNRYRGLQSCEVELRVCNTFDSEITVFILIFILFFPVVETLILGAVATSSVYILLVQGAWCLCAEGDRELVLGNNESENWAGQTWCQHFFVGFFFLVSCFSLSIFCCLFYPFSLFIRSSQSFPLPRTVFFPSSADLEPDEDRAAPSLC